MIDFHGKECAELFDRLGDLVWVEDGEWRCADDATAQAVVDAFDRAAIARVEKWEAIKAERDRRTITGGYQVAGKWFHSDVFSRSQQIGMVMLGASLPAGLQWKTMDGSFVTMTPTLAQQVFGAAAASDATIFGTAEAKRMAMEASATPWDYNVLAGWPPIFGE